MPIDRSAVMLTSYKPPRMRRPGSPRPERDSIYGDTYNGVPNPMVPHVHPYPTRFHGAKLEYPQPGFQYVARPYASRPFNGLGTEPFFGRGTTLTPFPFLDVIIGAGLGFLAAPKKEAAVVHAAFGGMAALVFGAPGIVGFLAAEVLLTHQELGRRKDIGELPDRASSRLRARANRKRKRNRK